MTARATIIEWLVRETFVVLRGILFGAIVTLVWWLFDFVPGSDLSVVFRAATLGVLVVAP